MGIWSRFSEHLDLMSQMFAKTGAVGANGMIGDIEMSFKNAVFRCNACTEIAACRDWLDTEPEGHAAPSFCANADLIDRLRASY